MIKRDGLSNDEAKRALKKYGLNEITRLKKINPLKVFLSQFSSPLILLLIFAAFISFGLSFLTEESSNLDSILILAIVLLSGIMGFFEDYKAEKTIESLKRMGVPKAEVLRNGKRIKIDSNKLVPGDVVFLDSGSVIPADGKLIESFSIEIDESILTGESNNIKKKKGDCVYMNTYVKNGHGKIFIEKTGMDAKVGQIASKLQEIKEEKTIFQKEISKLSKKILVLIGMIIIIIFVIGYFKYGLYLSLLTSISLSVAAIPEGLPAVIVLTLVAGSKIMWKNNSLIRKLSVTESIGSVDIICTDKTGTLTKNEMDVTKIFFNNEIIETKKIGKKQTKKINEIKKILICSALCNNSTIGFNENGKEKYLGDQTEIALRKTSEIFGIKEKNLKKEYSRINEFPFNSKRKMMSVIIKKKNPLIYQIYSKGAPEILIKNCTKIYLNGRIIKLDDSMKNKILEKNREFASEALRVLGFAFKEEKNPKIKEKELIWLGLEAMMDPPRKEVKKSIRICKTARIRVIMLTGDNAITAKSIAKEIGMETNEVIEGTDMDEMSDKKLEEKLNSGVNIFARISPFHKLRILEILKEKYRVAMTGDGVNDSLALKKSNVGISMGLRGTDVAKEASDIILLDDNFASITLAIKEGRRIFDNIKKFINYLFVCNLAEVSVLLLATLFLTLKEPILLPIQLLWVNLLTDGFPALALGVDPARKNTMLEPPRKKNEPIINKNLGWLIGLIGLKKTGILFLTFFSVLYLTNFEEARTALFTGFVLYEFVRIGSIRWQDKLGWFSNKWLVWALGISLVLQLIIIYSPLNKIFHIAPLGFYSWIILIIGTIVGYFLAIYITKIVVKFIK